MHLGKSAFYFLLIIVSVFGLYLRFIDYATVPSVYETSDELHYAWGGATLLKTGVPKSWSWFTIYKNVEQIDRIGIHWDIKSPIVEKPPLYFILSGASVLLAGSQDLYETDLRLIRILPLFLSFLTIFFVGILAKKIFNPQIGLMAALIYATTPFIVLANRMSLTENFLTPTVLLALIILVSANIKNYTAVWLVGLLSAIALLTKQIGISLTITAGIFYLIKRNFKNVFIISGFAALASAIYLLFAYSYDGNLFWLSQQVFGEASALAGLPEVFVSIFRNLTISIKSKQFVDSTVLVGYILLFSAPLWLLKSSSKDKSHNYELLTTNSELLLLFPFIYLTLFALGQSGSTPYTFWGWYAFPFLPFGVILLAKVLYDLTLNSNLFTSLILGISLGSSVIQFIFLALPDGFQKYWQYPFFALLLIFIAIFIKPNFKYQKLFLRLFFCLYLIVNILTVFNLKNIYQ